jgi:hypothetical protein
MHFDEEKLGRQILRQHNKYINALTSRFSHRTQRVVKEISYGLLAKQSALLSEIARALNENHALSVVINRLSENLAVNDFYRALEMRYMKSITDFITANTIIVIDDGDISKPRARKLEGLARTWDGSEHEENIGYPLFVAVAVGAGREDVIPILIRLFARTEESYVSDNAIIEEFVDMIVQTCGTTSFYVFDRGFCSYRHQKMLKKQGVFYVMRAKQRSVRTTHDKTVDLFSWAREKALPYSTTITSIRNGNEIIQTAWYRVEEIQILDLKLRCVIMQIEGHDICILYTNQEIGSKSLAAFGAFIISIYGHRWSVEEYNRFKKQVFDFENMRVQSLRAMKNFVAIMTITTGIISHIGFFRKSLSCMTEKIISLGRPLRPEVRFPHYRIAAGIRVLLERRQKPVFHFQKRHLSEPSPLPLLEKIDDKT